MPETRPRDPYRGRNRGPPYAMVQFLGRASKRMKDYRIIVKVGEDGKRYSLNRAILKVESLRFRDEVIDDEENRTTRFILPDISPQRFDIILGWLTHPVETIWDMTRQESYENFLIASDLRMPLLKEDIIEHLYNGNTRSSRIFKMSVEEDLRMINSIFARLDWRELDAWESKLRRMVKEVVRYHGLEAVMGKVEECVSRVGNLPALRPELKATLSKIESAHNNEKQNEGEDEEK